MTIVLLSLLTLASAHASAATPREELASVVAQVKTKPADRALRVKAITLARKLKPAVPAEAKRAFVMGGTFQKEAKTPSDFTLAIDSFQEALTAAPWWGDAYYNLSVSLESAGKLDEAKDALELYLLTKPKDAEAAQNRIYSLDAKRKLAAKKDIEAVKAATAEADAAAEKLRVENSIEGTWNPVAYGKVLEYLSLVITRNGASYDVKPHGCMQGTTLKIIHADETTIQYSCFYGSVGSDGDSIDLRREGAFLIGTETTNVNGSSHTGPLKFIRKQ